MASQGNGEEKKNAPFQKTKIKRPPPPDDGRPPKMSDELANRIRACLEAKNEQKERLRVEENRLCLDVLVTARAIVRHLAMQNLDFEEFEEFDMYDRIYDNDTLKMVIRTQLQDFRRPEEIETYILSNFKIAHINIDADTRRQLDLCARALFALLKQ